RRHRAVEQHRMLLRARVWGFVVRSTRVRLGEDLHRLRRGPSDSSTRMAPWLSVRGVPRQCFARLSDRSAGWWIERGPRAARAAFDRGIERTSQRSRSFCLGQKQELASSILAAMMGALRLSLRDGRSDLLPLTVLKRNYIAKLMAKPAIPHLTTPANGGTRWSR